MVQLRAERQNTLRGYGDELGKAANGPLACQRTTPTSRFSCDSPCASFLTAIALKVLALLRNSHLKPAAARRGLGAVTMDSAPGRTTSAVGVDRGGLDRLGAPVCKAGRCLRTTGSRACGMEAPFCPVRPKRTFGIAQQIPAGALIGVAGLEA
ncbi:hypothetical protein CKAH01_03318 [Colletotrichum kahawae]|uniref:Uncharacterized protein n=1 Tax=Colletotrichum kahawae TaxID=34407 RepID=A0AAE0DCY6_COLKA|nr:hypothetical protein CKAH01_03318 [Colletotrichum kahawae]